MSLKALPVLFLNLSGEMMYVLEQRLRVYGISQEQCQQVLDDIIGSMLNKRFITELFKPQELYSRKNLRVLFDKLAHTSIMSLNSYSMDKLFDLMIMAVKYQLSFANDASDIIYITLNHLDGMRFYASCGDAIMETLDFTHGMLVSTYGDMSYGELMLLRQSLAHFFQDCHIRVSMFLRNKKQNNLGRFILPLSYNTSPYISKPGIIKNLKTKKETKFNPAAESTPAPADRSIDAGGKRGTILGLNLYDPKAPGSLATTTDKPATTVTETKPASSQQAAGDASASTTFKSEQEAGEPSAESLAQLDMLASMLIPSSKVKGKITLNIFATDDDDVVTDAERKKAKSGAQSSKPNEKQIKFGGQIKPDEQLAKMISELRTDDSKKSGQGASGADLLDIMDQNMDDD